MADHTVPGVIAIVAIVLVVAVFLQAGAQSQPAADYESQTGANLAGQAYSGVAADADRCEPTRFCDGTKLVIVREDCSLAQAYCRSGCLKDQLVCA